LERGVGVEDAGDFDVLALAGGAQKTVHVAVHQPSDTKAQRLLAGRQQG
jgi:hypothetical protein